MRYRYISSYPSSRAGGRWWGLRWRRGDSTRLPPMWPGFKSLRRRHMWVEFLVGSFLCSEKIFAGYSVFPLSSKANIFKFQFRRGILAEEPLCACATSKPLFTYVFISLFQFLFVSVFVAISKSIKCKRLCHVNIFLPHPL